MLMGVAMIIPNNLAIASSDDDDDSTDGESEEQDQEEQEEQTDVNTPEEELPPIDEEPVDPCLEDPNAVECGTEPVDSCLTSPSAPECQDPCVLNPDLPGCPLPPCDPTKQECPAPPNKAPVPGTLFLPDLPPGGTTEPGPDEQMDVDTDGDGLLGSADNCPSNSNPDQTDADGDKLGDACDSPVLKPQTLNPSIPLDITVENLDNCPSEPNPDQKDTDGDGIGDTCDPDVPPAADDTKFQGVLTGKAIE
jgi:hypothetical protein